jgi:hypothetical protein
MARLLYLESAAVEETAGASAHIGNAIASSSNQVVNQTLKPQNPKTLKP